MGCKRKRESFDDPDKLSLYTVIRRDENGALKTVWYRDEYKKELEKVCALLEEAAALTTNEGMRTYLTERVKAFRTDDYLASDLAWMDMKDCNMDIVIGPIENYDDHLFEAKADILGLFMVRELIKMGEITDITVEESIATFIAGIVRSVRFGSALSHGKANMMCFNFMEDHGAFTRNADGKYVIDFEKASAAIDSWAALIL